MGKFTVSVFINRSQQDVFDFLIDPANLFKMEFKFRVSRVDFQRFTGSRLNVQSTGKNVWREK